MYKFRVPRHSGRQRKNPIRSASQKIGPHYYSSLKFLGNDDESILRFPLKGMVMYEIGPQVTKYDSTKRKCLLEEYIGN